jgi:hypothetical protein
MNMPTRHVERFACRNTTPNATASSDPISVFFVRCAVKISSAPLRLRVLRALRDWEENQGVTSSTFNN